MEVQDRPPLDVVLQTAAGFCVARALHVAADLGVADHVGEEGAAIGELARKTGADADALGRILRLLSAHGIFRADGDTVSHNGVSDTLRTDHPQSARDLARMFGLPFVWETFEYLDHSIRTGQPAVEKALPEGVWAWLAERPEASAVFNGAMIGKSFGQVAGVVGTFDFSRFPRIADVGGGRGHLLQAILEKYPAATGLLFEQPHVIDEVRSIATDRLHLQAGDFFTDALPECDANMLMEVIHDWDDDKAAQILSTVRRSAPKGSALLLIEQLMPPTPGPHWVKMLDVHMMALFAARQRSQSEYDRLAGQCGFRPVGTTDTPAGISVLEYEAV
jgi:hypothetical protein